MLGLPIGLRSVFDHILYKERQREIAVVPSAVRRVDSTAFPIDLKHGARVRTKEEIANLLISTIHVTDVDDGYGVAKYQIDRWRRLLERGQVPVDLLRLVTDPTDLGGSSYELALLERYSRAPYHGIASRRIGSIRNHRLQLRTSHAGPGGNEGIGFAMDCGNTEILKAEFIEIGRAALGDHIDEMLAIDRADERVVLVGHRSWERSRREDPGGIVWREIVEPVVDERAANGQPVVIGYSTWSGSGLPIPNTWTGRALYDAKGRELVRLAA